MRVRIPPTVVALTLFSAAVIGVILAVWHSRG